MYPRRQQICPNPIGLPNRWGNCSRSPFVARLSIVWSTPSCCSCRGECEMNLPYDEIWLVDFEFRASDGGRPLPICVVARELCSGRLVRLFGKQLRQRSIPPYSITPDALFAEFEIFAPGYVPDASYTSNILRARRPFYRLSARLCNINEGVRAGCPRDPNRADQHPNKPAHSHPLPSDRPCDGRRRSAVSNLRST